MMCVNYNRRAFLLATATLLALNILGQAQLLDDDEDFNKPWPTYSLQNMPKTQFTCHDKILGGYYADPETQCQMFHVCVKLPGVGVQDYRFLCPNSTAFDQELQICANWADVDCDKAVQYYDNNRFNDLYQSNVPDDNKGGATNAVEDEGTFHLQRAESGDVRRSKENQRIDQKSRPAANYGRHNYAHPHTNADNYNTQATKKPISSYYTPTTSSTTTTTTTERNYNNYNNNDDSKQDIDDIFKGSHSSHFFANRHGGREYDDEPAARSKPNDVSDFNRKSKTTETTKARVSPTRGQRVSSTAAASTFYSSTVAPATKPVHKISLQTSFNADFLDYSQYYKSTTASASSSTSNTAGTTPRTASAITSRFSFGLNGDYQTQEKIQPTTFNPNNAGYRFKTTSAAKYTEVPRESTKVVGKNAQDFDKEFRRHKPTIAARKQQLGPQESNYINHNEFVELPKLKLQQPQPFQAAAQGVPQGRKSTQLEPHYQRPRTQPLGRVGAQEPAPFSAPAVGKQREAAVAPSAAPARSRSFTSRGSITYKATTQRYADDEFYYPTTTAASVKKVTKEAFTPTTFKPTTYKKPYEQSYYQTQQTARTTSGPSKKSSSTAAALPTTANPQENIDEDDGQYHPELYENDFPRNRFKYLRGRSSTSTTTSTTSAPPAGSRQGHSLNHNFQQAHSHLRTQQQSAYQKEREQSDLSDEDELFKTAQSLNFGAASINKLRADIYKAEKNSQQYNSQYSPNAAAAVAPSSPKTFASSSSGTTAYTTSRPYSSSTFLTSTSTSTSSSTTTTSTTRRPTTTTTTTTSTTSTTPSSQLSSKSTKTVKSKKEQLEKSKTKSAGKKPAHADEDTSYDYAYYDTD